MEQTWTRNFYEDEIAAVLRKLVKAVFVDCMKSEKNIRLCKEYVMFVYSDADDKKAGSAYVNSYIMDINVMNMRGKRFTGRELAETICHELTHLMDGSKRTSIRQLMKKVIDGKKNNWNGWGSIAMYRNELEEAKYFNKPEEQRARRHQNVHEQVLTEKDYRMLENIQDRNEILF